MPEAGEKRAEAAGVLVAMAGTARANNIREDEVERLEDKAVLTFEDCLGLCALSEEEIRAIAEHEHIPQIVALELGHHLVRGPDGELLVSHMFIDDIRAAEQRGDLAHAAQLKRSLRHFIEQHLAAHRPGREP